jgi:hypothetical protein
MGDERINAEFLGRRKGRAHVRDWLAMILVVISMTRYGTAFAGDLGQLSLLRRTKTSFVVLVEQRLPKSMIHLPQYSDRRP